MSKYIAALAVVILGLGMLTAQVPSTGIGGVSSFSLVPGTVKTYSANFLGLASAASATDILTITGAPTGLTIIIGVTASCTETTAGIIDLALLTRTSADSAGTSTTATIGGNDLQNSAAGAIVTGYTANPTLGTLGSRIHSEKVGCMAPGTATPNDIMYRRFGTVGQGIVLHGNTQQLAVNLNGVTVSGGSFDITVEWIETASVMTPGS